MVALGETEQPRLGGISIAWARAGHATADFIYTGQVYKAPRHRGRNPGMNEAPRIRYTDGEYLLANPTWHEEDSPWKAKQIMAMAHRNDLQPRSICEVGCGAGGILEALHTLMPENISFVGYDISPQACAKAKEKEIERLTFHERDLLEDDDFYDLLLIIDVLEHIEDYFGFLRQIRPRSDYKIFNACF